MNTAPSTSSARQSAIAAAGLLFLTGVLLSLMAHAVGAILDTVHSSNEFIESFQNGEAVNNAVKGVLSGIGSKLFGGTADVPADQKKAQAAAASIGRLEGEMPLGGAIGVLIAGALLLFNSLLFGFIESWKALGTGALHEPPETLTAEQAESARRVRGLVIFAMMSQTVGVGIANIVAYFANGRVPLGEWFGLANEADTSTESRRKTKRIARWHISMTAVAFFFAAAAMAWAAHEMRGLPI